MDVKRKCSANTRRVILTRSDSFVPSTATQRTLSVSEAIHEPNIRAKIYQAALATSAATTFFDPVRIGDRTIANGGLGANNPAVRRMK